MSDQQPTKQLGNFVATTGQKPWPPVGTFVAAHGQFSMAVVTKPDALANRCATMMRAEPLPASRTVQTWPRLVGYQMLGITPPFGR